MAHCTIKITYPNFESQTLHIASQSVRGKVVVAPNNSGKTTYANAHPQWEDHDVLLKKEVGMGMKQKMTERDMKQADVVTQKYIKLGKNQLVATWWDPALVDAFVIIDTTVLQRRGLPDKELQAATEQAKHYRTMAAKHNIPIYTSFDAADRALLGH